MTQQERQEQSKEKIYQAALEEFGTLGYDAVNMERICRQHGISKGMMYHYYSNKDELFLLCAQRVFADLKAYLEQQIEDRAKQNRPATFRDHMMMREIFFQRHPKQKLIFEDAMLRPPRHLAKQMQALHAPIRRLNQKILEELMVQMALRTGLDREKAARFLGGIEYLLQYYQNGKAEQNLHSILETAEDVWDMALFGVLRQVDGSKPSVPNQT